MSHNHGGGNSSGGGGGAVWNQPGFNAKGAEGDNPEEQEGGKKWVSKSASDIQRARLARLMANPDKEVHLPQPRKEKDPNKAPEFVYNVMGSSAGAGSGEFHVYRQIRRKEMLRQKVLGRQREKEDLNEAYHTKLTENERKAEERTAKNRAKREKKKQALKRKREAIKKNKGKDNKEEKSSSSSESSEEEEEEEKDDKDEATEPKKQKVDEETKEEEKTKDE